MNFPPPSPKPDTATQQYLPTSAVNISRIPNGARLAGRGPRCSAGIEYTAELSFLCDPSATEPTLNNTLDDVDNCLARFEMKTALACGTTQTYAVQLYFSPIPE